MPTPFKLKLKPLLAPGIDWTRKSGPIKSKVMGFLETCDSIRNSVHVTCRYSIRPCISTGQERRGNFTGRKLSTVTLTEVNGRIEGSPWALHRETGQIVEDTRRRL